MLQRCWCVPLYSSRTFALAAFSCFFCSRWRAIVGWPARMSSKSTLLPIKFSRSPRSTELSTSTNCNDCAFGCRKIFSCLFTRLRYFSSLSFNMNVSTICFLILIIMAACCCSWKSMLLMLACRSIAAFCERRRSEISYVKYSLVPSECCKSCTSSSRSVVLWRR
jgi:hypothetical protein